jgi:penicillin-binding protein 1A
MMYEVVQSGTGTRARLENRQAAGKTGTTQAARDAWFLGFTADYVAGVWMGYDDNTPLTGVTGGGLPAEIWHEVMVRVHQGLPATPLPMRRPAPAAVAPAPAPAPAPGNTAGASSGNVPPAPQPQPAPNSPADLVERILEDVLGGLLGRRD